ncbi:death-associated inhibitor of apoptosis 1-like [Anopheles darlingi]|uniref:death-associated inhibitor of apoptosis 1-like n=1 Tax=Anopheles darlingi TaxID=43151 RepID=UPI0020FFF63B|nr:death-associated inhibitor of apoptosis 1-like [Anopheles darlingi]
MDLDRNFPANVPARSYDECGIQIRPHSYAENMIDHPTGDVWRGTSEGSSNRSPNVTSTDRHGQGGSTEPLTGESEASVFSSNPTSMTMARPTWRPEYLMYANEAARLKSFEAWPTAMSPKPQQLSDAGFFYTGQGDQVKCFSCGGGLKDWEPDDDPWEQHSIWYGNCAYRTTMTTPKPLDDTMDNERIATPSGGPDGKICRICYDSEYNTAFMPCGHVVACDKCASTVTKCPICQQPFYNVLKLYLS